ncbi:MAG TPA: hypothetical protein VMG31_12345 [Verrucomicrobiae bacterium]|nr:hypothetical protein [Verrucomicrobiae bacterium]
MDTSVDVRQLMHTLDLAYENSLVHQKQGAGLEATDLVLENASIRLSSVLSFEITSGSCQSGEDASDENDSNDSCLLNNDTDELRDLTDMLSYSAYRLENVVRSETSADGANGPRPVVAARLRSMEHLYRLVFAVSKMYLDNAQKDVYLHSAQDELGKARNQMEMESSLSTAAVPGYQTRMSDLSQLDDRLKQMQALAAEP